MHFRIAGRERAITASSSHGNVQLHLHNEGLGARLLEDVVGCESVRVIATNAELRHSKVRDADIDVS